MRVGVPLLAIAITALWPFSAMAQYSENVLYDFNFTYSPGLNADSQGNLYGAVVGGGANSTGAIFEMSPPGNGNLWWTQEILYSFPIGTGAEPATALIFDPQGNLYGATQGQGGGQNCGGVFKLSPPSGGGGAWTETDLSIFSAGGKEACGSSSLVFDSKGNLYGASEVGGANSDGVVYELSPPSAGTGVWNETILYTFTGGSDGYYPMANLTMDSHWNLYGTTTWGGSSSGCVGHGCGTVFQLSPPSGSGAWTETTLYTFTGDSDGGEPYGLTLDSNNNLYGSTAAGGNTSACSTNDGTIPGCGGIFELSPPADSSGAWTLAVLYSFSGNDGRGPTTGLTFNSAGVLFGALGNGGPVGCSFGCGLLFSLTPPSGGSGPWTETVLHFFSGHNDGADPLSAVLLDSKMNLYGTLELSGTTNCSQCGSIYQFSPTQLVPSSTVVVPSMNPATLGESVSFTATVTPSGPPSPTGTVGFALNGVAIAGCSSVPLSAGQSICSTSALPPGADSVVAVYSGDSNYSESAGAQPENVTEPQLGLTISPIGVSVTAGGSVGASLNVSVTQGTPSGATTFTCSGLPAGAACSFSPSQVTAFPATVSVTINTVASNARLASRPYAVSVDFVMALPGLVLLRRESTSKRRFGWPIVALLFLVSFLPGCGGSGGSGGGGTTGGSTNYSVMVTASAAGAASASATIDLTVLK